MNRHEDIKEEIIGALDLFGDDISIIEFAKAVKLVVLEEFGSHNLQELNKELLRKGE